MTEFITHDIALNGEYVKPGSRIKIKGRWRHYTYISVLCLGDLDSIWIICEDDKGNREHFRPGQLKKVVTKRSRKKNV